MRVAKMSISRRAWSVILVVVAVKAAVLLIAFPLLSESLSPLFLQNIFPDDFDKLALNLASGAGYRFFPDTASTLAREPGYPLLLALVFSQFGHSIVASKLVNLGLGLLTAWLVMRIATRFFEGIRWPTLAVLLFLLHPGVVIAESRGGYELLLMSLSGFLVLSLLKGMDTGKGRHFFAAGIVIGFSAMVRSVFLLYGFFLLIFLPISFRYDRATRYDWTWRVWLKNVGLMVLATVMMIMPWTVRNYQLVGKLIPTATIQGEAAYFGQYICENTDLATSRKVIDGKAARQLTELARKEGYELRRGSGYWRYFYSPTDEVAFSNARLQEVAERYLADPLLFGKCVANNAWGFWVAGRTWHSTAFNAMVQVPILVLAILGAYQFIRQGHLAAVSVVGSLIVYVFLAFIPIHAQARHSIPLVPFLAIFAAGGIAWVAEKAGYGKFRGAPHDV